MDTFSIKDIEALTGIKAHTLRVWEQRYQIGKPNRSSGNIRTYTDQDLKFFLNLNILYKGGRKISQLASLSSEQLAEEVSKQIGEQTSCVYLQRLKIAMLDFNEYVFEQIVDELIQNQGFIKAYGQVIIPFVICVGELWLAEVILPAHEHFVSNLIRARICFETSKLTEKPKKSPEFVIYLPQGERHELSALFVNYYVKQLNNPTLYLGAELALVDIFSISELNSVKYFITIITNPVFYEEAQEYLAEIDRRENLSCHFYLVGAFNQLGITSTSQRITLLNDVPALLTILDNL